jgi:fatty-acyl-CoA synthase
MRTHANEVANAWSVGQGIGEGIGPGKTLFCGLPMFHVNAVLVTGLLPFPAGPMCCWARLRAGAARA